MLVDHPDLNKAIGAKGPRRKVLWDAIAEHRRAEMRPVVDDYRESLEADGWMISPTYRHEPVEFAWTAKREGFTISGLSRPIQSPRGEIPKPTLSCWGPDGAAISLPHPYSMQAIKDGLRICGHCGAEDVTTDTYAFADRCCADCGPIFMKSLPSNWAD